MLRLKDIVYIALFMLSVFLWGFMAVGSHGVITYGVVELLVLLPIIIVPIHYMIKLCLPKRMYKILDVITGVVITVNFLWLILLIILTQ